MNRFGSVGLRVAMWCQCRCCGYDFVAATLLWMKLFSRNAAVCGFGSFVFGCSVWIDLAERERA